MFLSKARQMFLVSFSFSRRSSGEAYSGWMWVMVMALPPATMVCAPEAVYAFTRGGKGVMLVFFMGNFLSSSIEKKNTVQVRTHTVSVPKLGSEKILACCLENKYNIPAVQTNVCCVGGRFTCAGEWKLQLPFTAVLFFSVAITTYVGPHFKRNKDFLKKYCRKSDGPI